MNDEALLACSESDWDGDPARCRWCNSPLAGRRTRWCTDRCSNDFTRNHMWTAASRAARKRDGHECVRCGEPDAIEKVGTVIRSTLQVHHLEPVRGQHGVFGCHHHLDGLETLCQPCHRLDHHPASGQLAAL